MQNVWKTNTAERLDITCHDVVIDILQRYHIRLTLPKLLDLLRNRANPIIDVPGGNFHNRTNPSIFRSKVYPYDKPRDPRCDRSQKGKTALSQHELTQA